MLPSLVEFEVFRDHLGVAADAPEVDAVSKLLDAICAEVRRIARRSFEGDEGGAYSQVIRIRGAREFTLPQVPVAAVASIAPAYFDGTVGDAWDTWDWRLEDASRGLVRLRFAAEYVAVVWTTTGDIPAQIPQAVLEWGKSRWESRDQVAGLTGYKTGDDSETYSEAIAGKPSHDVMRAILGVRHATGGGVV
jgi:hypothetical protein